MPYQIPFIGLMTPELIAIRKCKLLFVSRVSKLLLCTLLVSAYCAELNTGADGTSSVTNFDAFVGFRALKFKPDCPGCGWTIEDGDGMSVDLGSSRSGSTIKGQDQSGPEICSDCHKDYVPSANLY